MTIEERERIAAAARRVAPAAELVGLSFRRGDRVTDLESGQTGEVVQAGRDASTGWELYRVRLADLREVFRTDRTLARLVALLVLLASPAAAQTKTTTLEWDYVGFALETVKQYSQVVTVDGAAQSAAIACRAHATRPADTTCSIPLPTLAAGNHVVTVSATLNGHTSTASISGVDLAKVPAGASSPRINVTVTVGFP